MPMDAVRVHAVTFLVATLSLLFSLTPASAEKKVALVIGNSNYAHSQTLPNPSRDADAVSAALTRLGFEVSLRKDLGKRDLEMTLADFSDAVAGSDTAIFYYAGHGMEIDGNNYLIPVDAALRSDNRVKFETVGLNDILSSIDGVKGLKLILLDACRNNPFAAHLGAKDKRSGATRGLAPVEPNPGMLVSYAAAAGTTADDGEDGHSPYTAALLDHIERPGLELNLMFRMIGDAVFEKTDGKQTPFEYGRLPGVSIYLKPPVAEPVVTVVDPCRDAATHWTAVQNSNNRAMIRDHLTRFRTCAFSTLAENALAALGPETEVAALDPKPEPEIAPEPEPAIETATPVVVDPVPVDPLQDQTFVRAVQTELNRVGCTAGEPDGEWGPRSVRAWEKYTRVAKVEGAATPNQSLLTSLESVEGRVCPLECGIRENAKNGRCVLKTCAKGLQLSSKGVCLRVANAPVAKATPLKQKQVVKEKQVSKEKQVVQPRADRKRTVTETVQRQPVVQNKPRTLPVCASIKQREVSQEGVHPTCR